MESRYAKLRYSSHLNQFNLSCYKFLSKFSSSPWNAKLLAVKQTHIMNHVPRNIQERNLKCITIWRVEKPLVKHWHGGKGLDSRCICCHAISGLISWGDETILLRCEAGFKKDILKGVNLLKRWHSRGEAGAADWAVGTCGWPVGMYLTPLQVHHCCLLLVMCCQGVCGGLSEFLQSRWESVKEYINP